MPIQQEDELKQALSKAYCDEIIAIRMRRRMVEERMLISRRQWFGSHLARVIPEGKSVAELYDIPAARRTEERFITRAVKMLTPSVRWFEVAPAEDVPAEKVSNVDQWMNYVLRKRIRTRPIVSQLTRCLMLYSFCVLKTSIQVLNGNVWPSWRAVDPFSFYIFPETAPIIEDAEKVFEDHLCSLERYKTYVRKGLVDDLNVSDLTKPDWPYHLVERLAYQGITDPMADVAQDISTRTRKIGEELEATTEAFVSLTELWVRREDVQYQVYIAWNLRNGPRIVGFFKSSYDEPLYRMTVQRPLPGELYTPAQAEDINELDNVQNDLFNQFMSSVDYEQGFVAAQADRRHDSWKAKGRALWMFNDDPKQAMQFIQPPITSVNQLRAFQIVTGLMQSMGGAGTIAEGQPGRNMPRAGFAMQGLVNLGMSDIADVAEVLEQEILTQALSDVYKVSNFIPDDQLMRIPGGAAFYGSGVKSNILRRQDILGDYEFEWVGAQQFQDDSQRAQRSLIMLNMLANPQVQQQLAQQGYAVNLAEMIQYIWRHTLGERGLSNILVQMPPMQPGVPGGQPMPGAPPAANGTAAPATARGSSGTSGTNSAQAPQQNGASAPMPGLSYQLPQPQSGFIQQR
jgi:hypothetical protein